MASFTTAKGVKMTADTIGTDQRGDIQDEARPDFLWFEDFETRISLMSAVITNKIWQNMEEAKNGLAKNGGMIFNCNYISERGNVHKLVRKIKNKLLIPIEENGEPTWPGRYTKEEIKAIKAEAEDYEGEYLNEPSAAKDIYFKRDCLDKQIPKQPIDEIAGLKIFRKYDPMNRICGGQDIGGGVGLDASTSVFLDLDCMPVQVIATYYNNEIKPEAFGYEIARQGKRFGECYVAPENNKYDSAIIILKQNYPTDKIHRTQRSDKKIIMPKPTEFGWNSNSATVPAMMADLDKAVKDGLIELNDENLINEAKSYTVNDLMEKEPDPRLVTRHFDLLTALAIAWAVRKFVKKPDRKSDLDYWQKKRLETLKKNPAR